MKYKFLLFFFLSVFTFTLLAPQLYAQQNNKGLSITPFSFEYSLDQQDKKTDKVFLTNLTNQSLEVTTEARNFSAHGEEGDVELTTENIPFSLASWVNIEPKRITIPAKSKIPFTFTITVPKNAEPGGHFGSVVFSTVPKKNLNQTGALLSQEVGALVFVKTPGEIIEKAEIASFATEKPFYEFGPAKFVLRVKNNSNVHIKPIGAITITDMFGKTTSLPLTQQNVLPNATRKIFTNWDQKILIGKYKATVNLSYGSKNQTLTQSTEFTAFPVRWGLIALGILAIIIAINAIMTLLIVKRHKRKQK